MTGNNVFIIGSGITKFGENYEVNASNLASQSLNSAIADSKIEKNFIDIAFFGSLVSGSNSQSSIGASCLANCNLNIPHVRIEAGNASGAAAFHQAYLSILSGAYDCVAVIGIEKLSDFVNVGSIERILSSTFDYQWEFEMGATLTSLYALLTKAHMKEYDTTMEQLASVPVKNHKNGVHNPYAQFRKEISLERFLNAKRIADPIGKFDPATFCDGSATAILASDKFIKQNKEIESKIPILGSSFAADYLALHKRNSLTEMVSTRKAATGAYKMSNIKPEEINVAEVHDAYPIGEILAIEDLGFFKKGEGGKASENGFTSLNEQISVNTSGGLKARGDPYGATGIAQIIEIVEQIRGDAGERQIDSVKYGLAHNVMGTGALAYVNIMGEEEVKR
ncbi:MAG: thiolase domain-containing protein [Candidatus Heimdallarchaeota archaeon]|nr:thiolase domain-containing protein [Candidatus Heimdallarchaeota archaeon]